MPGLAIAERRAGGFICQMARPCPRAIPPEYRPDACNSLDTVSARHAGGDGDSAYGYLTWGSRPRIEQRDEAKRSAMGMLGSKGGC
jgi:hypothetical protein